MMMLREGAEPERRRPAYRPQSSFDLHHVNRTPVSIDANTTRSSGPDPNQVPWWSSKRFRLSVLCFLGFACLCAQQVNLSVAIVCMARDVAAGNASSTTGVNAGTSPSLELYNETTCSALTDDEGQGGWSKHLQGVLLGAFFWGYLVLQLPAVLLTERFGAKKVVAVGMIPVAILTVLTPPAARASPYLLLTIRVIIGLGEALMYPAIQGLWTRWAPPWERGKLVGLSLSGGYFGTAIIFPIGGILCSYGFDGGWPSIFYIIGSLGFLWSVVWMIFAHDSPSSCPGISDMERKYIDHSLGEDNRLHKRRKMPLRSVFTSGAVWALLIAHMCGNYGMYMLLTLIPTYMKEVLNFDIRMNGVLSMLPFLCFWVCAMLSGILADFIINRKTFTVNVTRKIMSVSGMLGTAVFLIATSYLDCHQQVGAVILLCLAVGFNGANLSGYVINHGDIAPPFAGTLFGITNTAASLPGILAPYIVSAVTLNKSRVEWQTAFYTCAGVYLFGALMFLVFGSGKTQPWAKVADREDNDSIVSLRKPIVNGRRSRTSMRNTYLDNEESHVTIECDPQESYAESVCV